MQPTCVGGREAVLFCGFCAPLRVMCLCRAQLCAVFAQNANSVPLLRLRFTEAAKRQQSGHKKNSGIINATVFMRPNNAPGSV